MSNCSDIIKFAGKKKYKDGFTLLDLQANGVGGTAADRRLRDLREEGQVIDLYRKRVRKGVYVKVWALVRKAA